MGCEQEAEREKANSIEYAQKNGENHTKTIISLENDEYAREIEVNA